MDMKGHAAVVTGGASGLGAATAAELARAGVKVACLDVSPSLSRLSALFHFAGEMADGDRQRADDAKHRSVGLPEPKH